MYKLYTSENGYSSNKSGARQSAGKTSFMSPSLSDDYLIGFTEGEGMFYIGIVPSKETKTGWQVIYFFKLSQNPVGLGVLNQFKDRLGCGYIKQNSQTDITDKSLAYVVRDFPSLRDKVIPFFESKLIIKKDAFQKFKQVLKLVEEKKH
ncbi:LAGLIDADG family homing endonuclease, partial [Candidatus Daviesbacteria bacterium]|nr:LAGLIDADG family homing endonuclease [Candidatus Daviesbacteria bacterium]